jgi:hypothetical protein
MGQAYGPERLQPDLPYNGFMGAAMGGKALKEILSNRTTCVQVPVFKLTDMDLLRRTELFLTCRYLILSASFSFFFRNASSNSLCHLSNCRIWVFIEK